MSRKAIMLIGGPGSGKDYIINNILNRFDLQEVQIDQILNGSVNKLLESKRNLLVNCTSDMDKIRLIEMTLSDYDINHVIVSVTNKISKQRNDSRSIPMNESARVKKWLDIEKLAITMKEAFVFRNSINLKEANSKELLEFRNQIEAFLKFMIENDYRMIKKNPVAKNLSKFNKSSVQVDRKKQQKKGYKKHKLKSFTEHVSEAKKAPLEYGTDQAREAYQEGTPGQQKLPPTAMINPDFYGIVKRYKKNKLKSPPGDINSRIDGAGGYSIGGLTQTTMESFKRKGK